MTTTVTRSWLSRLFNSVVGVLIGIVLVIAAFVVLWNNEGRTDLSTIADDSVAISATSVDAAHEGKLVAAEGNLRAAAPLGDPDYLAPGAYVALYREVEMYAWVEKRDTDTRRNTGGSETTTTTYTYEKRWVTNPTDSDTFQRPGGHTNPPLTIDAQDFIAPDVTLGAFTVEPTQLHLPAPQEVPLSTPALAEGAEGTVEGEYLFIGDGSLQQPQVGDVRLHFTAVPNDVEVTLFGLQQGEQLVPFVRGDATLYRAFTSDREGAIATLHTEYETMGWIFRIVGFLLMWAGFGAMVGPVSTVLDVLPFLGNASRTVLGVLTFVVAAVLSFITVVISSLFHNPIALVILLLLLVGVGWLLERRRRASAPAAVRLA